MRAALLGGTILAGLAIAAAVTLVPEGPGPGHAPAGRIDGAVLDSMLAPQGGATVTLVELDRSDVTSPLGGFTFHDVPPGSYTLATTPAGTHGIVKPVVVTASNVTRIILQVEEVQPPSPRLLAFERSLTLRFPDEGQSFDLEPGVRLDERPDDISVRASWGGTAVVPTLQVELWDSAGELLASGKGMGNVQVRPNLSPCTFEVTTNCLSEGTKAVAAKVRVLETGGVPQPEVHLDVVIELYYGTTREHLFGWHP